MSIKLLKKMHHMVRAITGEDFCIAGGAVRDTLYGVEPKDYDMVLPCYYLDEADANRLLDTLSSRFADFGFATNIYQSYGVTPDGDVNPTSFQAMFLGCMKVSMGNCQVDILLSKEMYMSEHVQRHDCNMNMVWFNGERICWEHGGPEAKVETLVFNPNVCDARIRYMDKKRHELIRFASSKPFSL